MRPGSLRSVPIAAPSVQGKPCKARNGRWTARPHRESPRASVSASPVIIYYNACLKTQSDRLLEFKFTFFGWLGLSPAVSPGEAGRRVPTTGLPPTRKAVVIRQFRKGSYGSGIVGEPRDR